MDVFQIIADAGFESEENFTYTEEKGQLSFDAPLTSCKTAVSSANSPRMKRRQPIFLGDSMKLGIASVLPSDQIDRQYLCSIVAIPALLLLQGFDRAPFHWDMEVSGIKQ